MRQPAEVRGPAGIVGIVAGLVPSVASAVALRQLGGSKHDVAFAPNMLAKIFDKSTTKTVEYPTTVWTYLNSTPNGSRETRREQFVRYWHKQVKHESDIDLVTSTKQEKKRLTMELLSTRLSMLARLSSEVAKMNRLLNELEMALRGAKSISS